ncbi:MAG TPA: hypothetical protein VNH44_14840 [Micropepsaceae bacterium]|nr:hypothetical protein [Micropepsaceae bacterium]
MTKHVHMSPPRVHYEPKRPWLFWLVLAIIVAGGAIFGFVSGGAG